MARLSINHAVSLISAGALVTLVAACSDAPVAPNGPMVSLPRASTDAAASTATDTTVRNFTLSPGHQTTFVLIGEHKVVIPADVVCDPATTTYGPTEWEMPCTTITSSVTVTARAWR